MKKKAKQQSSFAFHVDVVIKENEVHHQAKEKDRTVSKNLGLAGGNFGNYIKNLRGNKI